MSGTIESVATLLGEQPDNSSGFIHAVNMRNLSESAFGTYMAAAKTSTPYTLLLNDRGTTILMNLAGANTVLIPTNSTAFQVGTIIGVRQIGQGQTTIAAVTPGTTTVSSSSSLLLRAQYSFVTLTKAGVELWYVDGDLA